MPEPTPKQQAALDWVSKYGGGATSALAVLIALSWIPPFSTAIEGYNEAQGLQIEYWRKELNKPAPEPEPTTIPGDDEEPPVIPPTEGWSPKALKEVFAWVGPDSILETSRNGSVPTGTDGKFVVSASDLSGKGNTLYGQSLVDRHHYPRWRDRLDLANFTTTKSVIAAYGRPYYGGVFAFDAGKPFVAAGEFYLAAYIVNTRNGIRQMWGYGAQNFTLDQTTGQLTFWDGDTSTLLGTITKGPLLVEVFRSAENRMFVYADGVDVSTDDVSVTGTVTLKGWGYDRSGSSFWDDYLLALVFAHKTTAEERSAVREFFAGRWK